MCEICQNWERLNYEYRFFRNKGIPLITEHHPNCPHYNDSLIDVWKVTVDGVSCYVANEQDALDSKGDNGIITKERMHKEIFDNLPEFEGF